MAMLNKAITGLPPHLRFVPLGDMMISSESDMNDHHKLTVARVEPATAPTGSIFTNNSSFTFNLQRDIDEIVGTVVELNIVDNHANAATTAVWTVSAKLADQTTDGTADGGVFCIGFPKLGVQTTPQVYNVSAANLQIAIRALHPALAAVTVAGGTFATPAPYTITMTHTADEFPLEGTEVAISGGVLDGAVICTLSSYMTTAYAVGGSLKLAPAPLLFKEVLVQGGDEQIEKIEGDHIFEQMKTHFTEDELEVAGREIGYDFEKQVSYNFINGASGTLRMLCPLSGTVFDQGKLIPSVFTRTQFKVMLTMQTGAVLLDSTSGSTATAANLQYSSVYLWVVYKKYPPSLMSELRSKAQSSNMAIRHWEAKQTVVADWSTLTAGTEVDHKLGLNGSVSEVMFVLRPSAATSAQSHMNSLKLDYLKVSDTHGQSVFGSDYVSHKVMRDIVLPITYPLADYTTFSNFNVYVWSPCSDVRGAKQDGKIVGMYPLTGEEKVKITPTAAAASQSSLKAFYSIIRTMVIKPDGHIEWLA
jgi:hypothetical protein